MDGMTHIKNIYKLRNRLYARRGVSAESAGLLLFAAARRQNIVRYDISETAAVVAAAAPPPHKHNIINKLSRSSSILL